MKIVIADGEWRRLSQITGAGQRIPPPLHRNLPTVDSGKPVTQPLLTLLHSA